VTLSYWFIDPWLMGLLGLIGICFAFVFWFVLIMDFAGFCRMADYFDNLNVWGGLVRFMKAFISWLEDILIMWVMTGFWLVIAFGLGAIAAQCIINPIQQMIG